MRAFCGSKESSPCRPIGRLWTSVTAVAIHSNSSNTKSTADARLWVVRVWEPRPPEGVEPLEWILLTNHPCETFEAAHQVKQWYECRWIIEEYHKGQKTGCGIEDPQFNSSDRLHPMIAILSVVALSLLNLRELSRREDAKSRPATDLFCAAYVDLLSGWRHGEARLDWTIYAFFASPSPDSVAIATENEIVTLDGSLSGEDGLNFTSCSMALVYKTRSKNVPEPKTFGNGLND